MSSLFAAFRLASPALPIGGFSYSQGLEQAIDRGWVKDEAGAAAWIGDCLELNIGSFEAPMVAAIHAALEAGDADTTLALNDEYLASRETAELRAETLQMGFSLMRLLRDELALAEGCADTERNAPPVGGAYPGGAEGPTSSGWRSVLAALLARGNETAGVGDAQFDDVALPLAWAFAAALSGLERRQALAAYLWAWAENQVMAALKAIPLGQQSGHRILSRLVPPLDAACTRALTLDVSEWSNFAPGFALCSGWHETQYSRMFRS